MRKFAAFLFALVFSSVLLYGVEDQNADIRYTRIDGKSAEIDFVLNKYEIRIVEYDGIKYSKIEYGGGSVLNKEGFAELPYFAASVQIEDLKNMDFSLEESDYDEVELEYPMLPSRGLLTRSMDISKVPYKISDESVTDSWYPEKVSYSTDPYIIRDVRGTSVVFHAYQYNSAKNILRINRSIKIRLTENDEQPVNPLYRKTDKVVSEMESVYRSVFINYNEAKALNIGDLGEILVVYTSQNGGLSGIQPYIEWKRQKGFTVNTLEVSNGTDLSVTGDIQTAYNGNPDILYVQIVGDFANIKSRVYDYGSLLSGANDPMLGWVAGSDYYQDIIVGRFSVQSEAQLAVQINKAINYEKNPETGGTWYAKGVGLASNEGAGSGDDGEGDEQHSEIIKNNKALPSSFTNYNTCYQSQSAGITEFSSYVNAGASYINYTGHGYYQEWSNPNITNTGVNNLINGTKLPYIISVACLVGNFNYASGDCFAEAWLKKENGGAVVGWFSTISQPWLPPMRGQDYFADILVGGYDYTSNPGSGTSTTEQRTTFGSLTINANHLMLAEAPTDADTRYTIETWTIFGDAALQVRRDTPKLITNSNTTLLPGNYSTTITATSGGAPVEGAMVTLYFNGENYTGLTNSSGVVSVVHNFTVGTDVTVTVSGFNLETEQAVFTVNGDTGGTFAVNQTSLSYGNVAAGSTSSQTFILTNDHTSEYLIGDITTPAGYIVSLASKELTKDVKNTLSYSVAPQTSKTFDLTFAPTAGQTYSGNVTITSSDTEHATEYIAVTGTGTVPELDLSVASISASASPGSSAVKNFNIGNTGLADLDYSLSVNYTSGKEIKGSGGPDTYGYKWVDSDEVGGPVYSWVDISGVGTSVTLTDDGITSEIALGMSFNFYGTDYTTIRIGANGALTFTGTSISYTNPSIPTSTAPNAILAPFWDDLDPSDGGNIYYYSDTANSRFIVSYVGIQDYDYTGGGGANTFQVLLYSSGKIEFHYGSMNGVLNECTIGIESGDGLIGSQVVYNGSYLKSNHAIRFMATPEWLSLDSTSGTVASGKGVVTINATCDAADLDYGTYTADITVTTNDPDTPNVIIPVTFVVSDAMQAPDNISVVTATSSQVDLSWDAVSGATVYHIYRSTTDPYSGYELHDSTTGTSYQDTDISTGNKYFYYITSDNAK